jgi:hypothetical protein
VLHILKINLDNHTKGYKHWFEVVSNFKNKKSVSNGGDIEKTNKKDSNGQLSSKK